MTPEEWDECPGCGAVVLLFGPLILTVLLIAFCVSMRWPNLYRAIREQR